MNKIIIKNSSGEIVKELDQDVKKTLISQMRDAGVNVLAACHHGICGACIYKVNTGQNALKKDFKGSPGFPLGDDEVMTCIAGISEESSEDIELQENSF